jgi:hypothetical protein
VAKAPRQEFGTGTPSSFPTVTPPFPQHGHDFTLQAVMEMQRTLGELCGKVDRMAEDLKSQGNKIDAVRLTLARVGGGIAVLVVLISLVGAAIRFWPFSH